MVYRKQGILVELFNKIFPRTFAVNDNMLLMMRHTPQRHQTNCLVLHHIEKQKIEGSLTGIPGSLFILNHIKT